MSKLPPISSLNLKLPPLPDSLTSPQPKSAINPKVSAVKKASMKTVTKKKQKLWLLFDANEFGNSNDAAYELDYAFRGVYLSKKDALNAFAETNIEQEVVAEEELFKSDQLQINKAENMLEEMGWKIIETDIEK